MTKTTRTLLLVAAVAATSCRTPPTYRCVDDSECGRKRGVCRENGCAFFDAECAGGYRWDVSAADHHQECVPTEIVAGDMADDLSDQLPLVDMATPEDLTAGHMAPDGMVIPGDPCTAGFGACMRNGHIVGATCDATPGAPDDNWHVGTSPNNSFDWDCDGHIFYQYPSGNDQPPGRWPSVKNSSTDCSPFDAATCAQDHWWFPMAGQSLACGLTINRMICKWINNSCQYGSTDSTTEACK